MATDAQLYEDSFTLIPSDKPKKDSYVHIKQLFGTSDDSTTSIQLDYKWDVEDPKHPKKLFVLLASTLNLDGSRDEAVGYRPRGKEPRLDDEWPHSMYGKVYKVVDPEDGDRMKICASFGGLLMELNGPYKKLSPLKIDQVNLMFKLVE